MKTLYIKPSGKFEVGKLLCPISSSVELEGIDNIFWDNFCLTSCSKLSEVL